MSIGDLFRSKIKHSDPEVRAAAVAELAVDQAETLAEIARDDDDFKIRRLALEKIEDTDALIGLAREAAAPIDQMAADRAGEILGREALTGEDESVALGAIARISAIGSNKTLSLIAANARLVSVKKAALAAIGDDRALADVVREANDEAIAQSALARIENHGALAAIAVSEPRRALALSALDRLGAMDTAPGTLERIEAKASHKPVRARARALLAPAEPTSGVAPVIDPARIAHAERVQLTRTMESLSRAQDFRREAEFSATVARFDEVGAGEDTELAGLFGRAAARYREGLTRYRARAERLALEGKVESEESDPDDEDAGPGAGADAGVGAGADADVGAGASEDEGEDAAAPIASPGPKRPKTLTPEEKRIILDSLCQNLEGLVSSNKIKTINKGLARAEAKFGELGDPPSGMPELLARLERSRQALLIRAGEIREALEWQQWANIAKQEQLIERAEKLAADEGAGKLGERLRGLQNDWKELGPAPRDRAQELWEKFKAACDLIYERVKVERKQDNEERKKNLAAKTSLCEQAEAVAESSDWAETAQLLKRLQTEWKQVGPVPRRASDKLWKRFRGACDKFFERRKPHLDEQLAEYRDAISEKTALIEEMESLLTDEARVRPLRERGERFDDLCRTFQRAGRVPPREFAAFRKRQDAVEKALKNEKAQLRAAAEAERAQALADASTAIMDARAARAAGTLSGPELAARVLELRVVIKDLGDGTKDLSRALEEEIRGAVESDPAAFKGTELDPEISRQRKEKLCKKVEKLVPTNDAGPSSAEDMAAKLRAALADRALGGVLSKRADPDTIKRVVTEARESWRRLGPVPGPAGHDLEARFKGACQRAQRQAD